MENKEKQEMTEIDGNHAQMSFGSYLKKVRLEKGISIEDVMDYTRISKFVLQQIEAENRAHLPEDVFLKGFLKAYAEAVGVDPHDVIERYKNAVRHEEQLQVSAKRDSHGSGSGFPFKMILACLVFTVVLVGFLVLFKPDKGPEPGLETPSTSVDMTDNIVEDQSPAISPEDNKTTVDGLHLEVVCVEETVLKISADGGVPEEYTLKPEDHLELKAKNMYNILIDNTCGVTLFLNNNPVAVPGKCGQTATIQLP